MRSFQRQENGAIATTTEGMRGKEGEEASPTLLPQSSEVAPPPTSDSVALAQSSAVLPATAEKKTTTTSAAASTTSRRAPPPFCRSRTDSIIRYTPTTQAEAPGATFYVDRKGDLDYVVLLKVSQPRIGSDLATLTAIFVWIFKYLAQDA